jgi:hypothetical protein
MKKVIMEIRNRWKSETPKFFKGIVKIGLSISGVALAMHLAVIGAGAGEPQWWIDIYPYIIAIPAGMAATAKLTRDYGIDDQK